MSMKKIIYFGIVLSGGRSVASLNICAFILVMRKLKKVWGGGEKKKVEISEAH